MSDIMYRKYSDNKKTSTCLKRGGHRCNTVTLLADIKWPSGHYCIKEEESNGKEISSMEQLLCIIPLIQIFMNTFENL